ALAQQGWAGRRMRCAMRRFVLLSIIICLATLLFYTLHTLPPGLSLTDVPPVGLLVQASSALAALVYALAMFCGVRWPPYLLAYSAAAGALGTCQAGLAAALFVVWAPITLWVMREPEQGRADGD